jgi:hypothetical protein
MRLRPILPLAGLTALLALGSSAIAATNLPAYGMEQYWCRRMHSEGEYARSLAMCKGAASDAKANATAASNWLSFDGEAQALEIAALDEANLGHHRAAYADALEAHRLSYYTIKYFGLDADDIVNINARINRLIPIEEREAAYVRRGIGD